jgi:hypothetical protein
MQCDKMVQTTVIKWTGPSVDVTGTNPDIEALLNTFWEVRESTLLFHSSLLSLIGIHS